MSQEKVITIKVLLASLVFTAFMLSLTIISAKIDNILLRSIVMLVCAADTIILFKITKYFAKDLIREARFGKGDETNG